MKLKKKLLEKSHLYVIVDKEICGQRPLLNIAKQIEKGKPDIIQFRDKKSKKESILKEAYALRKFLQNSKTIFIINDYLDIAKVIDSDGVHLGQDDISIELARRILGDDKIIGVSCHNLKQAIKAQRKGADYISIGPIFNTPTKPEYKARGLNFVKEVKDKIKIPFFIIGGIKIKNINRILAQGAERIAVCSAICQAKDIGFTTRKFLKILL